MILGLSAVCLLVIACEVVFGLSLGDFSSNMMSWSAKTSSMAQLVSYLKASEAITDQAVADVMLKVDRALFCDKGRQTEISGGPYVDHPLPLECGQTISAPHIHAMSLEVLQSPAMTHGARILDVGSGSGYVSACFAVMNPSAKVFGIDVYEDLVNSSIRKVATLPGGAPPNLSLQCADGWGGLIKEGPFHAINVGAAGVSIPARLANSLAVGGRMLIPVGPMRGPQRMLVVSRISGIPAKVVGGEHLSSMSERMDPNEFSIKEAHSVAFVPLIKTKSY